MLIAVAGLLPACSALAGTVTFDLDTGSPTLKLGQLTPFDQTASGVTAHFSSPTDHLFRGFNIQTDATTGYHLSQFSEHYLCQTSSQLTSLDVAFSRPLDHISLTFATIDYQLEVPTTIKLTAYMDSVQNPPVGWATAHGTYGQDSWPMGALAFDSAGAPFNLVRINLIYEPQGATVFLVDNVLVNKAPVTATSPLGFLNPGWNWFSLPIVPIDNTVANIFAGYDVTNILYRWDPVIKTIHLYPDDFTTLDPGESYLLRLTTDTQISYLGFLSDPGMPAPVPEAGWVWVGFPKYGDVLLADVLVHSNTTGETRTAAEDSAAPDAWINWNWLYWSSSADTVEILGLSGADDNLLHPWQGYRLWSNTANLEIVYPEP